MSVQLSHAYRKIDITSERYICNVGGVGVVGRVRVAADVRLRTVCVCV